MSKILTHEHIKHDFIIEKIKGYLLEQKQGASPEEIWNSLGKKIVKSRATVHNNLTKLIQRNEVYCQNHRYFIKDLDLLSRYWCGKILSEAAKIVLNPALARFNDTDHVNLRQRVIRNSPAQKFCEITFQKSDRYERFFFEFVNRIGAYIAYIFLESLRTSEADNFKLDDLKQNERKRALSIQLIQRSIDIEVFYDIFRNMLKELELNRLLQINAQQKLPNYPKEPKARKFANSEFLEMNKEDFTRVCKRFNDIYSGIYEGLEEYWEDQTAYVGYDLDTLESMFHKRSECDHEWKDIKIYKKDLKYYECLKCRQIANEYVKTRLEQRKRH